MDDFDALIHSLGEHVLDYVGIDHVRQVRVVGDPLARTAEVTVCLKNQTWAEQERAIDQMIELRRLFLNDLSISYSLPGDLGGVATVASSPLVVVVVG